MSGTRWPSLERRPGQRRVPVEFLRPNPRNPRKVFDEADLQELTQSIKRSRHHPAHRGAVDPEPAGCIRDRRRRAPLARRAERRPARVPVVVVDIDDKTSLEYRDPRKRPARRSQSDRGSGRLFAADGASSPTRRKISRRSSARAAATSRTCCGSPICPWGAQARSLERKITAGHGRALLSVKDPVQVAKRVLDEGLSVRQVEEIAQDDNATPEKPRPRRPSPRRRRRTRTPAPSKKRCRTCSASRQHRPQGPGRRTAHQVQNVWSSSTACAGG